MSQEKQNYADPQHEQDLKQAREDIIDVTKLATKTGVPSAPNLVEPNSYWETEEARADIDKHGVRVGGINDESFVDASGYYDTPGVETASAIVSHYERAASAQSKEPTGTYTTKGIYPDLSMDGHVSVERPDGNGGKYVGRIMGVKAERAAVIVGSRASKKVRRAVIDRAVSVADELKQEG